MQSILHQKIDTSITVGAGVADHVVMEFSTVDRHRIDLLAVSLKMLCIIELKNVKLVDLYEATMCVTLDRTAKEELTPASLILVERFFDHLRALPLSLWTESHHNPNFLNLPIPKEPPPSFPTKLDEFFYHGWYKGRKGTWSIHALWSAADDQAVDYARDLANPFGNFDDKRFKRHYIDFEDEDGREGKRGELHVLVVIVIAGICVLARRSLKYPQPKKTPHVLFPVGKHDQRSVYPSLPS